MQAPYPTVNSGPVRPIWFWRELRWMKGYNTGQMGEKNNIIQLGGVWFKKNSTYEQIGKKE